MIALGEWLAKQKEPELTREELLQKMVDLERWLYRNAKYDDAMVVARTIRLMREFT